MTGTDRGPAEVAAGSWLMLAGTRWQVRELEPHAGRVLLRRDDGQELATTIRALVSGACRPVPAAAASLPHSRGRQPAGLEDLTARQRELIASRYAHLMEAETGYRSGSPLHALPGEPRPAYDPAVTTLHQRRLAKVAEMAALGADAAAMLGLARISERTLVRWAGQCRRHGIAGCIDGHWLRRSGGRYSVTGQIREAIYAVHAECLHRSRVSMKTRERLIRQYVRERFGPEVPVPSYETLRAVWLEWFGPGGARQRYARSAAGLPAAGGHVVIHRPGQVVALDTSPLGVKVREHVFGEPVTASLTLALDLYTHSLVAFRLTLVSDTSVDVAMLLRDVMMPLPLRADWGFADLRLVCSLLNGAWPHSRNLITVPGMAGDLDQYIAGTSGTGPRRHTLFETSPLDARPGAVLITAAARILDGDDLRVLGEFLAPSRDGASRKSPRGRWLRRYQRAGHDCSSGFRDAIEPLTGRFQRIDRRSRGRRAPAPQAAFAPEHIPEHLQDDWYDQHFRHIGGNTRLLRRAAALRLVQISAGGSLAEAATFLGIDHRYLKASPGSAAFTDDPTPFRLAVHALARQLSAASGLINYQHRRDALRNWCIDLAAWQDIISQLPRPKDRSSPSSATASASSPPRPSGHTSPRASTSSPPGSSKTRHPAVTLPGTGGVTTCGTSTSPRRPNRTTQP